MMQDLHDGSRQDAPDGNEQDGAAPEEQSDMGSLPEPDCDPGAVFQNHGCTGCHGEQASAGLDLRNPENGHYMVNTRAHTGGCRDRLLIDPRRPEHSLFLQAVGAAEPPDDDSGTCNVVMPYPPADPLSIDEKACVTAWVHHLASEYEVDDINPELSPLRSSLQKVKTLLRGDAVTEEEVRQVANANDEYEAMRTLYHSWAVGDAFDRKMIEFFKVNLQQKLNQFETAQFNRLRARQQEQNKVRKVLEESFARTALHLVNENQSFTQIARTQTWMMTTANLVLLLYGDQSESERTRTHRIFSNPRGERTGLRQQINRRAWYLDDPVIGECEIAQSSVLNFLLGALRRRDCVGHEIERNTHRFANMHLQPEDFEDWRLVRLNYRRNAPAEDRIPFYDILTLRNADTVLTRLPRVGFFTTNAFFENWQTNEDNQFRVAVNQSLLAGLHMTFASSEPTEPLNLEAIDAQHTADMPTCYGCHRQLDPMRYYFSKSFNVRYQRPYGEGESQRILRPLDPSFAFLGTQNEGGDLRRFGRLIAEHPRFPSAWVQKLCHYANSVACNERDPAFRRIARRFADGGFNFKDMMVELFASPLVSQRGALEEPNDNAGLISVTRRQHLCTLLAQRTGQNNICDMNRVRSVSGLIPEDDFARGAVEPTMPVRPSAIYLAAAESVCQNVARTVVNRTHAYFSFARPEDTLENIVGRLMGLAGDRDRAARALDILTDHYETARQRGANQQNALRSAFTVGCLSPDVLGMGL